MSDWYTLDDNHNIVGPIDISAAGRMPIEKRRVARTEFPGGHVSTVFLQLDHSWSGETPILFETMVFGGPFDQEQERYATWAEAEAGHARIVEKCQPIMTEDVK